MIFAASIATATDRLPNFPSSAYPRYVGRFNPSSASLRAHARHRDGAAAHAMVAVRAPPVAAAVASEWTFVWGGTATPPAKLVPPDGDPPRPRPRPALPLAGCGRARAVSAGCRSRPSSSPVPSVFGIESTTAQDLSNTPSRGRTKSADISFILASRDDVSLSREEVVMTDDVCSRDGRCAAVDFPEGTVF